MNISNSTEIVQGIQAFGGIHGQCQFAKNFEKRTNYFRNIFSMDLPLASSSTSLSR